MGHVTLAKGGGIGASAIERIIWAEEESKFNVPGIFEIGLGMAGPVMMEYTADEQKAPVSSSNGGR